MKRLSLFVAAALMLVGTGLRADMPGPHPYYLHALSDLRAAKWNLEHRPARYSVAEEETRAANQINLVIDDIRKAAIDDGKPLSDHPLVDEKLDNRGRLHRALDLLVKVRQDISHDEDNGRARGLRNRSYRHLDAAIKDVRKAVARAEHEHRF
jgi:hypothetical protein